MIRGRVVLSLLAVCHTALALCGRPQPRLLRAEYSQSDAVVIAHLIGSQHKIPKDDQDYHLYTFEVEKTLRGSAPSRLVLWDENSSARVSFDIVRGRRYLLFLDRWADRSKDWWTADGCGHSGDVAQRATALRKIETFAALQSARITGEVQDSTSPETFKVVATRKEDGRHFETKLSDTETFSLDVPPGEYTLTASDAVTTFAASWMSYERAKNLKLEKGACAQVLLVSSGSTEASKEPD